MHKFSYRCFRFTVDPQTAIYKNNEKEKDAPKMWNMIRFVYESEKQELNSRHYHFHRYQLSAGDLWYWTHSCNQEVKFVGGILLIYI